MKNATRHGAITALTLIVLAAVAIWQWPKEPTAPAREPQETQPVPWSNIDVMAYALRTGDQQTYEKALEAAVQAGLAELKAEPTPALVAELRAEAIREAAARARR